MYILTTSRAYLGLYYLAILQLLNHQHNKTPGQHDSLHLQTLIYNHSYNLFTFIEYLKNMYALAKYNQNVQVVENTICLVFLTTIFFYITLLESSDKSKIHLMAATRLTVAYTCLMCSSNTMRQTSLL